MAYNNYYKFKKIVEIQNIVLEEQKNDCGVTLIGIYKARIKHQFHISYSTFNNYMAINAKAELKKMDHED